MKYHKERHSKIKHSQCPQCGKGFTSRDYLTKHMRIHEGENRKLFECEFCDKRVTNPQSLQIHRRKHTGEVERFHTLSK